MEQEKPNLNFKENEPLFEKKWYVERFHWLRDEHSDDLPDEDVRIAFPYGHPRCNTFKCQGNFIAGMRHDLQSALMDKMFSDPTVTSKVKEFLKLKLGFSEGKFTTKDELRKINDMLNDVINYLEDKS